MKRKATSVWKGTGKEGTGTLTTQSGAFKNQPYSFKLRFENEDGKKGTNPEELIAAAHAGCYNMALAVQLSNAGFTPEQLTTDAHVTLDTGGDGPEITTIKLILKARVPGISKDKFMELANGAKKGCPVSKVLNADISLEAELNS